MLSCARYVRLRLLLWHCGFVLIYIKCFIMHEISRGGKFRSSECNVLMHLLTARKKIPPHWLVFWTRERRHEARARTLCDWLRESDARGFRLVVGWEVVTSRPAPADHCAIFGAGFGMLPLEGRSFPRDRLASGEFYVLTAFFLCVNSRFHWK